MPERTAAEVLVEKLKEAWDEVGTRVAAAKGPFFEAMAERLAEDPAITVRTDMVVERFVVEFHVARRTGWQAMDVHQALTSQGVSFTERPDHRIIVRPYPEDPDA